MDLIIKSEDAQKIMNFLVKEYPALEIANILMNLKKAEDKPKDGDQ